MRDIRLGRKNFQETNTLAYNRQRQRKKRLGFPDWQIINPFDALYTMNFNRREGRTIFLSRHGESEYNLVSTPYNVSLLRHSPKEGIG